MSSDEAQKLPQQPDYNVPGTWTKVSLIEPSTAGYVHVGANSGSWRLPIALPRARRRWILDLMHAAARGLRADPGVTRADVFEGLLRPPGQASHGGNGGVPDADFDAVLLVETTTVAAAATLRADQRLVALVGELRQAEVGILVFAGSNARRIGPVDHDRQGVFLFNFFSADSVESNLFAWQFTAGWFQDQTGLDNSTVLQPLEAEAVPYTLVNHCRWDRMRDVLPHLVGKRSFRNFVLRVFADNGVTPRPILYRLHGPVARQSE